MSEQDLPPGAPEGTFHEIGPYVQGPEPSGFAAEEIDTSRPHPARMYDYYLGGWDNYEVDRVAAERVIEVHPQVRLSARANRAFMRRAVRDLVAGGIRQIIDIGTGIPTSPNTHEVARETAPDTRVVYVDNDPIVATHAGARLTNTERTGFVLGDVRDPKALLDHPTVRELIDFDRPVALLLVAVLHFIRDDEDPAGLIAALAEALPTGSHLVLSHATGEPYEAYEAGRINEQARDGVVNVYKSATAPLNLRSKTEIAPLFGPFALLEPGVVRVPLWRPNGPVPGAQELNNTIFYGGVGRKG
ncbi:MULTISPECIES: SAM-dependent methyltransferase [unclassified Streptomyces]|uniref:SAM-dependent methyltransferase n=1 Tax=unclassified Streptomyces TaxID=2593676 RepID=UPI00088F01A8|nr:MULTISPECIES: SAM-dependent methyltransferase [unclassified Streptomyces]PBC86261.1 S-adenosyl methyltransferase [Streptomyces sp. 2321.6]SDQ90896.1 S-adenosyl methyltransferase [Streptomyces sp. KS_16]SED92971.1 S-adenosyl methyltransferase [Streptomyces sp. 2133.1]SNC73142.1 S-adenosyl methyltransferase [Streptomyces sp. 2114.4]